MSQLPPGFVLDGAPQQASRSFPGVIQGAPDPYKAEDQQMQRDANARAAAAADRQAAAAERQAAAQERQAAKDAAGTEAQQKIATLLTRIAGGFQDIQNTTARDPSAQEPGLVETVRGDLMPGGLMGIPARAIAGADRRTVHDSQRDVLDALLTLGTGAAYAKEQLTGQMGAYFPAYGDTPDEIAVKNQRMLRLIESAKANAGPAWAQVEPAIAPYMQSLGTTAPEGSTVKDGKIYGPGGAYLGVSPGAPDGPLYPNGGGQAPDGGGTASKLSALDGDQSGLAGLGTLATQGVTLGLSDEASGVGGAIAAWLQGKDASKAYADNRDAARLTIRRARDAHPIAGPVAEFLGGGAGAGVNALASPTLGTVVRQGATLGGAAGFGYGEGADSVPNALVGAATGGLTGGALYGAGKGINALAGRRGSPVNTEVVAAGERQGIPVRQPDARSDLRGRYAAAESGQTSGPLIREARAADTTAMEGRVADIGGHGNASDPYALGSSVQGAGQRYIAKTRQQADRLYKAAENAAGGATVTARNADAVLDANIQELRAAGENSNAAAIKYLEGLRSDIDKGLSLKSVQNLRTNMRGQIGQQGLTGTDTERRVGQVIDAMTQDLAEQLPKEASQALRAADAFYKERQTFINDTLKQFMGSRGNPLSAETAASRLVSMTKGKGNFERFSRMWQQLEDAERADVSATVAASLGRTTKGEFSPAALIKSLDPQNGLNPRTTVLLFGRDGAAALQDLRLLAQAKSDAMNRLSPSGQAISGAAGSVKTLLMSVLGLGAGGPAGAVAGGMGREFMSKWGEQRAARMLLNPDFTKWLKNAPNTTRPQVIDRYFSRLAAIPSIAANDNAAFVGAVRAAFAGPHAAAAKDEEKAVGVPPQK